MSDDDRTDQMKLLGDLARRYCWDMTDIDAEQGADRILRRAMSVADWSDTLRLQAVFGPAELRRALASASPGSLTERAWSFWHYRLGVTPPHKAPPPPPLRAFG